MEGAVAGADIVFAFSDKYQLVEFPYCYYSVDKCSASESKGGAVIRKVIEAIPCQRSGAIASGYFEIIYNNFWLTPRAINLGIIVEDFVTEFYLWNSYLSERILNGIVYDKSLNYEVQIGTLPQVFRREQEKKIGIHVFKRGNPVINDKIVFKFDVQEIYLPIEGMRIVIIADLCRANEFKMPFSFVNTIAKTDKQVEQRRNITDRIKRKVNMSVILNETERKTFVDNMVRIGQEGVFAVPIIVERMTIKEPENLQGAQVFYVNEAIEKFFNLQRCKLIGLYDKKKRVIEIAKVANIDISTKKIILETPIRGNFLAVDTVVYPVLLGYLENYEAENMTIAIAKYNFVFNEALIEV